MKRHSRATASIRVRSRTIESSSRHSRQRLWHEPLCGVRHFADRSGLPHHAISARQLTDGRVLLSRPVSVIACVQHDDVLPSICSSFPSALRVRKSFRHARYRPVNNAFGSHRRPFAGRKPRRRKSRFRTIAVIGAPPPLSCVGRCAVAIREKTTSEPIRSAFVACWSVYRAPRNTFWIADGRLPSVRVGDQTAGAHQSPYDGRGRATRAQVSRLSRGEDRVVGPLSVFLPV